MTIPPKTLDAWLRLALWEIWMGMLVCLVLAFGIRLMSTSTDQIVVVTDLRDCYGPPPVPIPCERVVYRGGLLNAAFTSLFGLMLVGVAGWFLWELWSAVAPRPVTDDFLELLDNSFGRNWRNPLTWPWARVMWAYGFTVVGAVLTIGIAAGIWALASSNPVKPPIIRVETSQTFRLGG